MYQKWKQYQYYTIIGVISLVALFFLPMIGSEAGLAWNIPNTTVGWVVFITSKLLVATLNILIFHCFILQGKANISQDAKYLEANEILERTLDKKELAPKSPEQWTSQVYSKKGVTIFITSILSSVGLTQAVLTFDWISMLTYFFTVLMGVIFGVLQMNQTEIYWTTEYWQYAKKIETDTIMAEEKHLHERDDHSCDSGGTDVLVSTDSNSTSSDIM